MKISRRIIAMAFLGTFLGACGSGDGVTGACSESAVRGSWTNSSSSETLSFEADCTGTSDYCESTFTYPNVTGDSGTVLVTVTSTAGSSGCLPLGESSCAYLIEDSVLAINCGGGNGYYEKQ